MNKFITEAPTMIVAKPDTSLFDWALAVFAVAALAFCAVYWWNTTPPSNVIATSDGVVILAPNFDWQAAAIEQQMANYAVTMCPTIDGLPVGYRGNLRTVYKCDERGY